MTRARAVSALWTAALLVVATVALAGITMFMMRVHRGQWWSGGVPDRGASWPARAPSPDATVATPPGGSLGAPLTAGSAVAVLRRRALTLPVPGIAASALVPTFSQARGSRVHEALDILAPAGTPVVAVEDGRVARLFTSEAGGLTVYQFDPTQGIAYYYAHLGGYAEGLAEGQTLTRGQVIGYVGSTGNASPDAPHLHFAIFVLGPERRWWDGTPIDPYDVLR